MKKGNRAYFSSLIIKAGKIFFQYFNAFMLLFSFTIIRIKILMIRNRNKTFFRTYFSFNCDRDFWRKHLITILWRDYTVNIASAPSTVICSTCHIFLFHFRSPRSWLFMSNSVFLEKQSTLILPVQTVHTPSF